MCMWWVLAGGILAYCENARERRNSRRIPAFPRAGAGAGAGMSFWRRIPACGRGNPAKYQPDIPGSECFSAVKVLKPLTIAGTNSSSYAQR